LIKLTARIYEFSQACCSHRGSQRITYAAGVYILLVKHSFLLDVISELSSPAAQGINPNPFSFLQKQPALVDQLQYEMALCASTL
jgi:hypothetical protein